MLEATTSLLDISQVYCWMKCQQHCIIQLVHFLWQWDADEIKLEKKLYTIVQVHQYTAVNAESKNVMHNCRKIFYNSGKIWYWHHRIKSSSASFIKSSVVDTERWVHVTGWGKCIVEISCISYKVYNVCVHLLYYNAQTCILSMCALSNKQLNTENLYVTLKLIYISTTCTTQCL